MHSYRSVTRDRGVTTIPADLRATAALSPGAPLAWVEVAPRLWLVGPEAPRIEAVAPAVAAALLSQGSDFPKLLRRLAREELAQHERPRVRRSRSAPTPILTEEQMIELGTPSTLPPRRHRGRDR